MHLRTVIILFEGEGGDTEVRSCTEKSNDEVSVSTGIYYPERNYRCIYSQLQFLYRANTREYKYLCMYVCVRLMIGIKRGHYSVRFGREVHVERRTLRGYPEGWLLGNEPLGGRAGNVSSRAATAESLATCGAWTVRSGIPGASSPWRPQSGLPRLSEVPTLKIDGNSWQRSFARINTRSNFAIWFLFKSRLYWKVLKKKNRHGSLEWINLQHLPQRISSLRFLNLRPCEIRCYMTYGSNIPLTHDAPIQISFFDYVIWQFRGAASDKLFTLFAQWSKWRKSTCYSTAITKEVKFLSSWVLTPEDNVFPELLYG